MRVYRELGLALLVLLAVACAGPAWGAERKGKAKAKPDAADAAAPADKAADAKKPVEGELKLDDEKPFGADAVGEKPLGAGTKAKAGAKDPVAAAFMLPKGVRADKLDGKQTEAIAKLKTENEAALRSALEQVETATGAEKQKAMKDVKELRKKIQLSMQQIVFGPAMEAAKKAREEQMKRMAEEQKRVMENQRRMAEEYRRRMRGGR